MLRARCFALAPGGRASIETLTAGPFRLCEGDVRNALRAEDAAPCAPHCTREEELSMKGRPVG